LDAASIEGCCEARSCKTAASERGAIEMAVRVQSVAKKVNLGESATMAERVNKQVKKELNNKEQDESLKNGANLKRKRTCR